MRLLAGQRLMGVVVHLLLLVVQNLLLLVLVYLVQLLQMVLLLEGELLGQEVGLVALVTLEALAGGAARQDV